NVTHEELRPLLAGYAAGTLDEAGCEVVRRHLAGGCVACLRDVFDRPVGLPRTPASPAAPAPRPAPPRRRVPVLAVGVGVVLGAPGLEVLQLAAVAPFRDVRGHVLWHPTQDTVLLYASGLPLLPAGSSYQVRLAFDEDREQAGPSFRPDGRGALALAIPLGRAAERLHAVRVLLEPAAEPVLAGARSR